MKIQGFLYGHYDSRGGTIFVAAATQEEADRKYVHSFWPDADPALCERFLEDDRICTATLETPEMPVDGVDLESDGMRVFCRLDTGVGVPDGDFLPEGVEHVMLVHAEEPPRPKARNGYGHPRWDDDAFSFLFLR